MVAVSKNIIAPANCWSFDLAKASINRAPASVRINISATTGSALKILFKSKPIELITGPNECFELRFHHGSSWEELTSLEVIGGEGTNAN